MNIKKALALCIPVLIFISCGEDEMKTPEFSFTERLSMDNVKNLNTLVESPDAHSGKIVARVDSGKEWGMIYTYNVPDSLVGKQLAVSVNAWVKAGAIDNPGDIICSVTNNRDSIMLWNGFGSKNVISAPNQWANLTSTISIPRAATSKPNVTISIIAFNSKASYFEVDDLNITYFEVNN